MVKMPARPQGHVFQHYYVLLRTPPTVLITMNAQDHSSGPYTKINAAEFSIFIIKVRYKGSKVKLAVFGRF